MSPINRPFDLLFTHLCTITRKTTDVDEYNEPEEHYEVVGEESCRFYEKDEDLLVSQIAVGVVKTDYGIILLSSSEVLERDQITLIVDEDGLTDDRVFKVEAIIIRPVPGVEHKYASLTLVS